MKNMSTLCKHGGERSYYLTLPFTPYYFRKGVESNLITSLIVRGGSNA